MKKFKILTILSFITFSSILTYKYMNKKEQNTQEVTEWKTFEKESGKVISHTSTKEELSQSKVLQKKSRAPASKKRIITGPQVQKYKNKDATVRYINTPSKDWKEKFAKNKLLTLQEGTKVLIKHKQSVLKVTNNGAKYLEKVTVSILKEDGVPRSYEALIDSETGKQENAWNRTHHENVDHVIFSKKL